MADMRDYKIATEHIKAPDDLKTRVLSEARRINVTTENSDKLHVRHRYFIAKIVLAAILVFALSATAFAVVKSMSLKDRMTEQGISDKNTIDALSTDEEITYKGERLIAFAEDEYAEYKVLEAVCDAQTIRVHAHIVPKDKDVMLIAQDVSLTDPAGYLGIPGATEGTVGEYADANGKTLRYATFIIDNIDGIGVSSECEADGSLHVYLNGSNAAGLKEIHANCVAFTYSTDLTGIVDPSERINFEAVLQNKSSLQQGQIFTKFDSRIEDELGISIEQLRFEESELCYYAVFTYRAENPENIAAFRMIDENGEYFQVHGLGDSTCQDNGDGSFTYTEPIPKLQNLDNLMFRIVDGNFDKIGPFSYEP